MSSKCIDFPRLLTCILNSLSYFKTDEKGYVAISDRSISTLTGLVLRTQMPLKARKNLLAAKKVPDGPREDLMVAYNISHHAMVHIEVVAFMYK